MLKIYVVNCNVITNDVIVCPSSRVHAGSSVVNRCTLLRTHVGCDVIFGSGVDQNRQTDSRFSCIATVATDVLRPGNKSGNIMVGACDNGPLEFRILSPGKNNCKYTVSLIFHSSVIEDASPPTCDLSWNGTYLVPSNPWKPEQDLLPACFTADSREGYHMTYYWFHILEWFYE